MNAKKAKTNFLFNVFLTSIAAEPLEISNREISNILSISESSLSKLRHSRAKKMPAGLHPGLMAAKFAAEIVNGFAPTRSTAMRFIDYARLLGERYIISESLSRFAALLNVGSSIDEERAKKLYTGMIPELIKRCYEESYSNSEQDYANWVLKHSNLQSDVVYQKICDTINQDVLDSEKLRQLLNVVYAAGIRHQLSHYFSDLSFLEVLNNFIRSQVNQPFYNSIRRSERISIADDAKEMTRAVSAREQVVAQTLSPVEFTLQQSFHHAMRLPPEEIVKRAFEGLDFSVDGKPLIHYINMHENTNYVSPLQLVTVSETEDDLSGTANTNLVLTFTLHPTEVGEPINMTYQYSCKTPFINNISCNYSYTLQYPCKFLDHEFSLDEKTRRKWGVRVKLFAPITNSLCERDGKEAPHARTSGTMDTRHVTFYDWAMPGSGYYRNLYELKSSLG